MDWETWLLLATSLVTLLQVIAARTENKFDDRLSAWLVKCLGQSKKKDTPATPEDVK